MGVIIDQGKRILKWILKWQNFKKDRNRKNRNNKCCNSLKLAFSIASVVFHCSVPRWKPFSVYWIVYTIEAASIDGQYFNISYSTRHNSTRKKDTVSNYKITEKKDTFSSYKITEKKYNVSNYNIHLHVTT